MSSTFLPRNISLIAKQLQATIGTSILVGTILSRRNIIIVQNLNVYRLEGKISEADWGETGIKRSCSDFFHCINATPFLVPKEIKKYVKLKY